jgi:hypothetical protein
MAAPKKDHYDDEDVPAALKRETQDGSGFKTEDELPESDFESFAEADVEMTEEDPK